MDGEMLQLLVLDALVDDAESLTTMVDWVPPRGVALVPREELVKAVTAAVADGLIQVADAFTGAGRLVPVAHPISVHELMADTDDPCRYWFSLTSSGTRAWTEGQERLDRYYESETQSK